MCRHSRTIRNPQLGFVRSEQVERGYTAETLEEVTAATGAVRTLLSERAADFQMPIVNVYGMGNAGHRVLSGSEEVIWASERDGFMHYYLYNTRTNRCLRAVSSSIALFLRL